MKDVPALNEEPFITTMDDYVSLISLELASVYVPADTYSIGAGKDLTSTWEKIDNLLLQDEDFGLQFDRGGFLKDNLTRLGLTPTTTIEARAAAVYALVRDAVKYNDYAAIYTSATLRKTFELHQGNAADINLLLIAALRTAGVNANPVLLSTRDHGRLTIEFPMASRFNYVVAHVAIPGGQDLLLDATDPLLPAGMLPERCLNQLGRLVLKEPLKSRWIDLKPSQRRVHFQRVSLTLAPEGSLTGQVHEEFSGYAGVTLRAELEKLGETKYRHEFAGKHTAWTVP
jgi:hypothetical protein